MKIDHKKSEVRKNVVTQTTSNMIFLLQLVGYVRYLVFTKRITTYRRSIQLHKYKYFLLQERSNNIVVSIMQQAAASMYLRTL